MPSPSEPAASAGARGWLLDTNVVSELRKGARCDRAVAAWAGSVPPVACFLSRVTIAEILFGIEQITDPAFRSELEAWLRDGARAWFGDRILDVDEAVLLAWRRLVMEGQKACYTYSQPDALIAATARVHGLAVATRNVEDFVQAGLPILNPWHCTK
jgi:predicted nucleic acid-binding protein